MSTFIMDVGPKRLHAFYIHFIRRVIAFALYEQERWAGNFCAILPDTHIDTSIVSTGTKFNFKPFPVKEFCCQSLKIPPVDAVQVF